jgi:hypothetical protein
MALAAVREGHAAPDMPAGSRPARAFCKGAALEFPARTGAWAAKSFDISTFLAVREGRRRHGA